MMMQSLFAIMDLEFEEVPPSSLHGALFKNSIEVLFYLSQHGFKDMTPDNKAAASIYIYIIHNFYIVTDSMRSDRQGVIINNTAVFPIEDKYNSGSSAHKLKIVR